MQLHLTKKDFIIDWFSGSGAGGQYRNKHQNCCRITHIETGLRAQSTAHRERSSNQRDAFRLLVAKIIAFHQLPEDRRSSQEVVRTYQLTRNDCVDELSGTHQPAGAVLEGDLDYVLKARRAAFQAGALPRYTGRM